MFPCRIEELPPIGKFLVSSAKNDLADFSKFSPTFTDEFVEGIVQKVAACDEVISSSVVSKKLKTVTENLKQTYIGLRLPLNQLEGYLNLSGGKLDIAVNDFGLKEVRKGISKGNVEGIIACGQKMLIHVKRNQEVLEEQGMKPELPEEISNF